MQASIRHAHQQPSMVSCVDYAWHRAQYLLRCSTPACSRPSNARKQARMGLLPEVLGVSEGPRAQAWRCRSRCQRWHLTQPQMQVLCCWQDGRDPWLCQQQTPWLSAPRLHFPVSLSTPVAAMPAQELNAVSEQQITVMHMQVHTIKVTNRHVAFGIPEAHNINHAVHPWRLCTADMLLR